MPSEKAERVAAIRRFNRFHTKLVGALDSEILSSKMPLPQVRILYELGTITDAETGCSSADLARGLNMDPGYLSRLVVDLEEKGLLIRSAPEGRGRRKALFLTERGRELSSELEIKSSQEVSELLAPLSDLQQNDLVNSMVMIEKLLGDEQTQSPVILRPPMAGDFGWVIFRHAALYATEYGFNNKFEALVAKIIADYASEHDPNCEACWIAEHKGKVVGSVFVMRQCETTAKLRLLYVEPDARGLGIGKLLVNTAIGFAKNCGYETMTLWTNAELINARTIYEKVGFQKISQEAHSDYGKPMMGETWNLTL